MVLTGGVELFNQYALHIGSGQRPLPLENLARAAYQPPWSPDDLWIIFLLGSTLIPTFGHLALVIGAAATQVTPRRWRAHILLNLRRRDTESGPAAFFLNAPAHFFTARWFLSAGVVFGLGWLGLMIVEISLAPVGEMLFQLAMMTIGWVRG